MRGSEKINPSKFIKSKYIKETTLDVLSGVAFLCNICATLSKFLCFIKTSNRIKIGFRSFLKILKPYILDLIDPYMFLFTNYKY